VKLSGEDLSRYLNKIESVGLRKCPYYHYLTKKGITLADISQSLPPQHDGKTADMDMV